MEPLNINASRGILVLDPKRITEMQARAESPMPNFEIPHWAIGNQDDMPDYFRAISGIDEMYKMLRYNPYIPIPDDDKAGGGAKVCKELQKIEDERIAKQKKLSRETKEHYKTWKYPTDRPPRVMAITTRFSSVMQHSAASFLHGFAENGCETRLVIEREPYERTYYDIGEGEHLALPIISAVHEFKPDLILSINFYRNPEWYPECIPVYTHIEDRLPHNKGVDTASRIKTNDYIGHV